MIILKISNIIKISLMISSYQVPNYLMVFNILISFMFLLLETLQLETWTLVKPVHQTYLLGFTSISILRLCHLVKMVSPLHRLCFLAIVKQAESGLAKADFWITMMKRQKDRRAPDTISFLNFHWKVIFVSKSPYWLQAIHPNQCTRT